MKFTVNAIFKQSPKVLYEAWLDSEIHSKMTGGEAIIDTLTNGTFSAWDGYIQGKNIELVPFQKIKQSWRTIEFTEDEEDSIIIIDFTEENGESTITLTHFNLPQHGIQYKQGWHDNYFIPMKRYFAENT